jgi:hypothetical protein
MQDPINNAGAEFVEKMLADKTLTLPILFSTLTGLFIRLELPKKYHYTKEFEYTFDAITKKPECIEVWERDTKRSKPPLKWVFEPRAMDAIGEIAKRLFPSEDDPAAMD